MTSKIRKEIRHTFCFKHILSLWWNLGGKSNDHQKTAGWTWNQLEEGAGCLTGILKEARCFVLQQSMHPRGEMGHILQTGYHCSADLGTHNSLLLTDTALSHATHTFCVGRVVPSAGLISLISYSPVFPLFCSCFPAYQVKLGNRHLFWVPLT